jgi:hypothetical protein
MIKKVVCDYKGGLLMGNWSYWTLNLVTTTIALSLFHTTHLIGGWVHSRAGLDGVEK